MANKKGGGKIGWGEGEMEYPSIIEYSIFQQLITHLPHLPVYIL
jgi:hypothetical protein